MADDGEAALHRQADQRAMREQDLVLQPQRRRVQQAAAPTKSSGNRCCEVRWSCSPLATDP